MREAQSKTVSPSLKGGRDAPAREEKVEGTRGQSTTREAPMGSVKRERWQYIKEYLDRIHIRSILIGYTLYIRSILQTR